jgi:hypothetical protein
MNILENRANCINRVRGYINEIAPRIIEELEKGFSLTKDCALFKRDKERVKEVIDSKEHFRVILKVTEYSIYLVVDDRYRVSEHSVKYYEETVYLWNMKPNNEAYDIKSRELVETHQLESAVVELRELKEQASQIDSRISKLQRLLGRY